MNMEWRNRIRATVRGFTLVEMLVVIAVISLLASMIFPVTKAVNRNKIKRRSMAELAVIKNAIDSYKTKLGHYPPDNPDDPRRNQLMYELLGTTLNNGTYTTLDGSETILTTDLPKAIGPKVTGLINSVPAGGSDEGRAAGKFLPDLKATFVGVITNAGATAKILMSSIPWPDATTAPLGTGSQNPFRYNSSNPTHNAGTYDLWVDVMIDGRTNRISNWSDQPTVVYLPGT
jgi:prepilin-type N-terminal cleavage/methylation domain-containing protein